MKPTYLRPSASRGMILGILIFCGMVLIPTRAWPQHAATRAGHPTPPAAAAPRPGMVHAPHAPTAFHSPVAPFRFFAPSARRRHFPIFPVIAWPGFFGTGYGAYWYPNCAGYAGWGYACGTWSPYYSYAPEPVYPSDGYAADGLPREDLGTGGSAGEQLPRKILLYLKDGSVFGVASYSIADGKLHYVTGYGGQNDIDLNLLDVQKTIDQNAARGITFTPTPSTAAPAPPSATPPSNQ